MTVRRSATEVLDAPMSVVAHKVRAALRQRPYARTCEERGGEVFRTTVKTGVGWLDPVVLGTDLEVRLNEQAGKTKVTVETRSQPMICGDIFGMYNRYIRRLLTEIRRES
jgi:hypothetical protein